MIDVFDENLNCAETHATFRILADNLEPEEISAALRILPSTSARKGEPNPLLHSARPLPCRTGCWMLTSEERVTSTNLEAHLVFLLDQLEPERRKIKELSKLDDTRVELHCYWMSETGQGGPFLSANVLERIVALGVDLDFDLYFAGE